MNAVIVDDNPTNLFGYLQIMKRIEGVESRTFTSSAEAYSACVESEPDLIILDYLMPAPDGLTFLTDYRGLRPAAETPIVMITGDVDRAVRHRALELGASDFLTKPIDPVEFVARVSNLIALRRSRLALRDHAQHLAAEVAFATREIADREEDTIQRLMRAAEFRDNETGNHIVRMGHYAALIGAELGLSTEDQRVLFLATPMHDIGKVATPDSILLKPGKLTEKEWMIMRRHTTAGHTLLDGSKSPILRVAADIALRHHERWDGSGYPGRLAGDAIPLAARIAAVGDVYDALISTRPYKEAWTSEAAFAEIARGAGSHFDPKIVGAFVGARSRVLRVGKDFHDAAA
jgi:response regulator RpfG family c-di-GMP phosphodiesterase